MVKVNRWRLAGFLIKAQTQPQSRSQVKLFIKFEQLEKGYKIFISDFNNHLWSETLCGTDLQERLNSEASGLEIETDDLLKLLDQMCQSISESQVDLASGSSALTLKTFVKIGFIKLKWTFKTKVRPIEEFIEMIRNDFLMPMFANLRPDKVIKSVIGDEELDSFYDSVIPNLSKDDKGDDAIRDDIGDDVIKNDNNSVIKHDNNSVSKQYDNIEELTLTPLTPVITEDVKRRELEEQLAASKKKKKKLI